MRDPISSIIGLFWTPKFRIPIRPWSECITTALQTMLDLNMIRYRGLPCSWALGRMLYTLGVWMPI